MKRKMRSWTKEKNNEVKQKEGTQKRQWRKEVEETWDGEKRKNGEMREKKKERKAKRDEQKDERKKWTKKKWW